MQKDNNSAQVKNSYLMQGNTALREKNYNEAIKFFKIALNKTPDLEPTISFNIAIAEKRLSELTAENLIKLQNKKIIVYTCNFGNYESIKEPKNVDPTVEYILFTDNKEIRSENWKIVVLNEQLEDSRRTSRLAKILPHKYLPAHDFSIYIDSSLELKVGDVRKMVAECMEGKDIALYKHYKRNCVYDEIEFVMNSRDRIVADKNLCLKAIEKYKSIGYPKNNGLFENAFIFRRNTQEIRELSETWWKEYSSGAERDQFTFMYSLWATGITPNIISRGQQFRNNDYVDFYKHAYRSYSEAQAKKVVPHIFIAYAPKSYGMNLGRCYNEYMERLNDGEFALFIDHDAMFVNDSWKEIISDIATKHADDVALFISRTNRINNPYQRLNLLEENHRIEDHHVFSGELANRFSTTTTECSKLPSSSGVIIMLSKKTWEKHKFSDGFLKVDNNMHLSHRASSDPVYIMNGIHVYHFYRADNDSSHAVKDISSLPAEKDSAFGHIVRNFVYKDFSVTEIDRYMNTLKDDEYGVFLPEQSMFCNKDWYIRIVNILEQDKNIGLMVFNDNNFDSNAPIELDALKHKIYSANMIEKGTSCLHDLGSDLLGEERRAFLLSKRTWIAISHATAEGIAFDHLLSAAVQTKQKAKFVPSIYVFNSKIDHRKKIIANYLDKQLNVGILTMGFWPQQAGMEMMVHNLATQITKAGSNVVLFTPKPKTEFEELKSNYIIRRFKDFEDMKRIFREHHAAMPFDVLYVQGAYEPASLALELKQELGIPVILRTHGEDIQIDLESGYGYRLDPKKNEIILRNIKNVDHNVVIGPHILKDVKDLTDGPVSLIFNGVDTDHFKPGRENLLHERLGLPKETKILITVGRNVKKKSLHLAIDALVLVKKDFPNVVLVHAGKEGNGLNLREYAIAKGASDNFYQIGEVSYFDMPGIYRSADIFVFPSKTETFGNVTVEAMACGLPCVEFDYEVNRDKIMDGKNGYIVEYGNLEKMALCIYEIISNPTTRNEFGKTSRAITLNKFSWNIVREKYNNIFINSKINNISSRILTCNPRPSGLNNQRMAILGLALKALSDDKKITLPEKVMDHRPKPYKDDVITHVPLSEIFDIDKFTKKLDELGILYRPNPFEKTHIEEVDNGLCFELGSKFNKICVADDKYFDLLTALNGSPEIKREATFIAQQLPSDTIGLQLRIEKDWKHYIDRKFGGEINDATEMLTTDASTIFKKISNTKEITSRNFLICCDESDLPISIEELKIIALEYEFSIYLKSEMKREKIFTSSMQNSLLDFEICLMLDGYIGLSRSTFSNSIALYTRKSNKLNYVYNNPGETCLLRNDSGSSVKPWKT